MTVVPAEVVAEEELEWAAAAGVAGGEEMKVSWDEGEYGGVNVSWEEGEEGAVEKTSEDEGWRAIEGR